MLREFSFEIYTDFYESARRPTVNKIQMFKLHSTSLVFISL